MKVILTLVLIGISYLASAQGNVFCFTFEQTDSGYLDHVIVDTTDTNNIWQIGAPDKPVFDSAHSYPNASVTDTANPYPAGNTSSFIIAFPKWINVMYEIRFRYKLDVDSGDFGRVEYSHDSGAIWHSYNPPFKDVPQWTPSNFSESTNGWKWAATTAPTGYQGQNDSGSHFVRFTFISDSIPSTKDGWIIDDICISYYLDHVEERYRNNLITISPNPSDGHIKLQSKITTRNANIQVYNLSGQKVFETNTILKGGDLYLPLPDGMYVLKYADERDIAVKRIVIQH